MKHSKVMLLRTHGSEENIHAGNGYLTIDKLSNFPSDFLSYSELIVYGACLTGSGGEDATNLVNITVAKGAQTVVGFECEVAVEHINLWCESFFNALAEGSTVEVACEKALELAEDEFGKNCDVTNCYIGGDKTATFP